MPTYDYQCRGCGTTTEVIHSMLEDGPSVCERCGGELRRVLFPTGIIFKGSGFYKTDSRSSGSGSVAPGSGRSPATAEAPASTADAPASGSSGDGTPAKGSTPAKGGTPSAGGAAEGGASRGAG